MSRFFGIGIPRAISLAGVYVAAVVLTPVPGFANARSYAALYSFGGKPDGARPYSPLMMDSAGNLFGTAHSGGSSGAGTIFRIAPDGTESELYSFAGKSDGRAPYGGVAEDSSGNLYGTTYYGGAACNQKSGCGTVFKLSANGTETILHAFAGSPDGRLAGLRCDSRFCQKSLWNNARRRSAQRRSDLQDRSGRRRDRDLFLQRRT